MPRTPEVGRRERIGRECLGNRVSKACRKSLVESTSEVVRRGAHREIA